MHSHIRKSPRMTDYQPSISELRDAEHKRQIRKLLASIIPALIVAVALLLWRYFR